MGAKKGIPPPFFITIPDTTDISFGADLSQIWNTFSWVIPA
jgi:hypothetical protein